MTATPIVRMYCGKNHPRLYALPDGAQVDWSGLAPWIIGTDGAHIRCRVPECGASTHNGLPRAMRAARIHASHRPDVPCDDRCMTATGHSCRCSCAGSNHGAEQ